MTVKKTGILLVAILFLMNSFTVFVDTAHGESRYADKIRFEVRTSETTGVGDTATGNLDVFLEPVSGATYDGISDDWKRDLGYLKNTGQYNNLLLNPVHDKGTSLPVVPVSGQYEFNPFGI